MDKLIQTAKYSIVYGDFKRKNSVYPYQELFRCPRELDNADLPRYVNENRCLLGFEADTETEDLRESDRYFGYFRMYFRSGTWQGKWMEANGEIEDIVCHGIDEIIKWLSDNFPHGCNWEMDEHFKENYPTWGIEDRYLIFPIMSEHYKVLVNTRYGNGDYPVRIYVYE